MSKGSEELGRVGQRRYGGIFYEEFLPELRGRKGAEVFTEMYFSELESFPESKFKDMVDAGSSAFAELESSAVAAAPPTSGGLQKASYWKNK